MPVAVQWDNKAIKDRDVLISDKKLTEQQINDAAADVWNWANQQPYDPGRKPHKLKGKLEGYIGFHINGPYVFILLQESTTITIVRVGDYH